MHDDNNNGDDCAVTTLGESVTIQYKKKKERSRIKRERNYVEREKKKR